MKAMSKKYPSRPNKNFESIRRSARMELSIKPPGVNSLLWLGRWGTHKEMQRGKACIRNSESGVIRDESKINSIDYFSYYLSGGDSSRCYNRDEGRSTDDES